MNEQEKLELFNNNINLVHGYLHSKNIKVVGYDYDDLTQELSIKLWDLINKLEDYDTNKTKLPFYVCSFYESLMDICNKSRRIKCHYL